MNASRPRIPFATTPWAFLLALTTAGCGGNHDLRAYIALDQQHSERLVRQFEEETGLVVDARYDTEASKTVGLTSALLEERSRPRCDVFWNNELAQTVRLGQQDVLQEYRSKNATEIPAQYKSADGTWTGFAARARILIVNTDLVDKENYPTSMWDLLDAKWRGKAAVAIPLTGTTLTHFTALRETMPKEDFDRFIDGLFANDVALLTSNGATMRAVAEGKKHFAFTDTDDYHVAKSDGFPVTCVFPDQDEGQIGTMLIPNSISLVADCPNPEAGREFIDWVLRGETEALLASARSAQIPLRTTIAGPGDKTILELGAFRQLAWDAERTAAGLAKAQAEFETRFGNGGR